MKPVAPVRKIRMVLPPMAGLVATLPPRVHESGPIVHDRSDRRRADLAMDPLSDVLSLLRPTSYSADGCGIEGELAIQWPRYAGIRCYALLAGEC